MFRARLVACLALLLAPVPEAARAQTCEISPFGGYRFGGDLYEVFVGRPLDIDGAPSVGMSVDLFVDRGTSVSFLYSRQQADVATWPAPAEMAAGTGLFVEHWHVGGTHELDRGRVRPFLTGTAGLTRFGSAHDSAVRFSAAGGGGVKLMASKHVGARLDARAYAVFVDGHVHGGVCGGGACFIDVDVFVLWQVEFTAGLVVSF